MANSPTVISSICMITYLRSISYPIQIPEEYALISASRNELLGALLVPAHKLLQELVAHAASLSASTDPVVQQLSLHHRPLTKLTPREMLVLHLMHTTGAPPAARLPSAESDQVSMLLEMLEGESGGIKASSREESPRTLTRQLYAYLSSSTGSLWVITYNSPCCT